jgi:hypothetical protein
LIGRPEENRTLGRLRQSWEDNIKMDFLEAKWGGMDWIDQERNTWWAFVNDVMNLRFL